LLIWIVLKTPGQVPHFPRGEYRKKTLRDPVAAAQSLPGSVKKRGAGVKGVHPLQQISQRLLQAHNRRFSVRPTPFGKKVKCGDFKRQVVL